MQYHAILTAATPDGRTIGGDFTITPGADATRGEVFRQLRAALAEQAGCLPGRLNVVFFALEPDRLRGES